jgi:hypothetical protein
VLHLEADLNKTGNVRVLRRVHVTTVVVESNKSYVLWVCICSLSYLACTSAPPAVQCICMYLSHKRDDFRKKKVIEHKMCFLFAVQLMCASFLILRRIARDMITSHIGHHGKYPLFLSDLNETRILDRYSKSTHIKFHDNPSIRNRVVPCGRTDGRKDTTKLIVAFRNFVNAPEICVLC